MKTCSKSSLFSKIIKLYIMTLLLLAAQGQDSIQPCFSAFPVSAISPISSVACDQLYDCLQSCLSNPACQSAVWDEYKNYCFHFSQTARVNPTILLNKYGTAYYERSSGCGGSTVTASPIVISTLQPNPQPSCPTRNTTAYFVVTETELFTSSDSTAITYNQENQCIAACTDQTNPSNGASLPCSSFTVLPKTKQCIITTSVATPDGNGVLKPNVNAVYAQKFCLPANAAGYCVEQFFFLFPQQDFQGHTISTLKATSLSNCGGLCSTTANCKAAVYDSNSKDCVLKNDNAINSKNDLKPGTSSMYYFENGCLLGQRSSAGGAKSLASQRLSVIRSTEESSKTSNLIKEIKETPVEWSNWSPCQYIIQGHRSRIRTASNCYSLRKCSNVEYKLCGA